MEEGLLLSLQFTAFDIHKFQDRYCLDRLTITDGDGTTLMRKNCGSSLPPNITSTSNTVMLEFRTYSAADGNTGWNVTWSAVTPGKCQQDDLLQKEAILVPFISQFPCFLLHF